MAVDHREFAERRPLTLFLLDSCYSGTAARLPWQLRVADGRARAWVIAASEPDRSAFDGRFSHAVASVLRDVAAGRLGIDPSVEFVPLDTAAKKIRRNVANLAAQGSKQQVTSSVMDIGAEISWQFFPNPVHRELDSLRSLRASVEHALAPFLDELDEGIDATHFVVRAVALGPVGRAPAK